MYKLLLFFVALGVAWYLISSGDDPRPDAVIPVTIDRLLKQPGLFDGKDVSVTGVVTRGAGVMGYGGFWLRNQDLPAEILILTGSGIPPTGAKILVFGRFHEAFTLNN